VSTLAPGTPIEVWFQDEMRVGQKNNLVYQWARKGSRPRQPKDQRYENAYVFGAVCPSRDTGVALIMPQADTEAMQAHLEAIGRAVAPSAHALLILDKAGCTQRASSTHPAISPLSRCRQHAPNLTRPRTSGSICARLTSPTVCSRTTPPFSTPARTHGENFSPRPAASPQSHNAIGSSSVNLFEGWYKAASR
jgi:hypothetical protein